MGYRTLYICALIIYGVHLKYVKAGYFTKFGGIKNPTPYTLHPTPHPQQQVSLQI